MNYLLKVTLTGLISGMIGTGIGGLTVFFVSGINKRFLSFVLEFSAGLMTAVVCFKLIPEAIGFGGIVLTLAGVAAGVLSIVCVEEVMNKKYKRKTAIKRTGLLRAGILMAIGIAIHNFPEGFAIGAGFEASVSLGIILTAVIVIHDIPEGIAMAVPMKLGGYSSKKAFYTYSAIWCTYGLRNFIRSNFRKGICRLYRSMPGLCCWSHAVCCTCRAYN